MAQQQLGIYINDHLAGAAGGVSLAKRAAQNATDEERSAMWQGIAGEIEEDRQVLGHIRNLVGAQPNRVKYMLARVGERLGRLKTNGYIVKSSDLGQMLELEMMLLGVTGKLCLWEALSRLEDPRLEEIDLDRLIERAEAQRSRLEQYRISIAPAALGDGPGSG